jgi:hypothetical protein
VGAAIFAIPAVRIMRYGGGAFVLSAVAFLVAAVTILTLLRPDPLLTARAVSPGVPPSGSPSVRSGGWAQVITAVRASPSAALGLAAVVVGHLVM